MTTKEVLIAARAKVAQGWAQTAMRRRSKSGPCYCAIGAIFYSSGRSYTSLLFVLARHELTSVILDRACGEYSTISAWNDAPGRTQDEVLATFDKAIEACA